MFFSTLRRLRSFGLPNFQKVCLNIFDGRSLFCDKKLSSEFMKKFTSEFFYNIHLPKEYEVERGVE